MEIKADFQVNISEKICNKVTGKTNVQIIMQFKGKSQNVTAITTKDQQRAEFKLEYVLVLKYIKTALYGKWSFINMKVYGDCTLNCGELSRIDFTTPQRYRQLCKNKQLDVQSILTAW